MAEVEAGAAVEGESGVRYAALPPPPPPPPPRPHRPPLHPHVYARGQLGQAGHGVRHVCGNIGAILGPRAAGRKAGLGVGVQQVARYQLDEAVLRG